MGKDKSCQSFENSDKRIEMPKMRNEQERAFFGRRQGKPLRPHQRTLRATLLPDLRVDPAQDAPADIEILFATPVKAVRLEIGFGGGEHLLHEAARCPDTGFIGVEPFVNGMAKILGQLENVPDLQKRLRLYDDDATRLLDWLPDQSLDGIDLFYPDPWPKKKTLETPFCKCAQSGSLCACAEKKCPVSFCQRY